MSARAEARDRSRQQAAMYFRVEDFIGKFGFKRFNGQDFRPAPNAGHFLIFSPAFMAIFPVQFFSRVDQLVIALRPKTSGLRTVVKESKNAVGGGDIVGEAG